MNDLSQNLCDESNVSSEAHLFLDTNVLIHYPALDGLDWSAVVGVNSIAVLHICEPVLEEIAKKKDMGETKRLRKRCDRLVKRISELLDHDEPVTLSNGIRIVIDATSPNMEVFPELNSRSADDRLLACALSFARSTGLQPLIVTADVSLALRAKLKGLHLQNLTLSEAERLTVQSDPEEAEKRELQQQVKMLTAAQPKLTLQFDKGGTVLQLEQRPPRDDLLQDMFEKEKAKFPFAVMPETVPGAVSLEFLSQQEVNVFNAELTEYFQEYEQWLEQVRQIIDRSHDIVVLVSNTGSSPAFGAHVRLRFPDGLNLVEKEEFEDLLPEHPSPPEKPRDWLTRIGDFRLPITRPHFPITPILASENMSIRKTNSFDVDWEAKKIRQGETKSLSEMVLVYDDKPFSFEIPFEMVADNLPNAVTGALHVHFNRG